MSKETKNEQAMYRKDTKTMLERISFLFVLHKCNSMHLEKSVILASLFELYTQRQNKVCVSCSNECLT